MNRNVNNEKVTPDSIMFLITGALMFSPIVLGFVVWSSSASQNAVIAEPINPILFSVALVIAIAAIHT